MIKSVVVSLIALSIASVPVAAEARDRDGYRGGNNSEHREHRRSRISTGEAIALGVGAFILGAAVSSKRIEPIEDDRWVDREYRYNDRYQYRTRTCNEEYQPLYNSNGQFVQYVRVMNCY